MRSYATVMSVGDARMTTRQLAGRVAWMEINRHDGADKVERIMEISGLSRPTIRNIRIGKDTVSQETFWKLAGALGLPTEFFGYIIAGDVERLQRLPGRDVDPVFGLREDLRQFVLDGLGDGVELPRNRRKSDRRR